MLHLRNMAIAVISAWLGNKNRSYEQGVMLYQQYGTSAVVKALISSGKSDYHQKRLFAELDKLNETSADQVKPAPLATPQVQDMPVPKKRYAVSDEAWNKLPESIKDLYGENTRLHARSQLLFHQLRICSSDEARLEKCLILLDDRNKINDNWKAIKDFNETGKIREQLVIAGTKTVDEMTMQELMASKNNIPTYLTKARKKVVAMEAGHKKNKVLHRIAELEVQLELVKKRLANV